MKHLEHIDRIYLRAAEGWSELGDFASAISELDEISPEFRTDPVVLLMRCQIYQDAKKWPVVMALAETLVQQLPAIAYGWIYRSHALHELKRTQESYNLLRPAATLFSQSPVVHYDLACYACQLGKLDEAMNLLGQAINLSGIEYDLQLNALLEDPDLEPLRDRIRETWLVT